MNFTCRNCTSLVIVMPGDRPPPWCSKCGADFKSDDPQFLALSASLESDRIPLPAPRGASKPRMDALADEPEEVAAAPQSVPASTPAAESDPLIRLLQVVGAVLLITALVLGAEALTFVKNGQPAEGRVALVTQTDAMALGLSRSELVIQYEVNGGKYQLPVGRRDEGDRVPILYQPTDPQDARVNTPMTLYRWPLLVGGGGLMLLISGLLLGAIAPGSTGKRLPVATEVAATESTS